MTTKRVVLQQTQGLRAGLFHICGYMDEAKGKRPPDFLEKIQFSDHTGPCSLVAIKRRYVLYREIFEPKGYSSMNERQL